MPKFRILLFILLFTASPVLMNAQDDELILGLRGGHNEAFGGFAAISLETIQELGDSFSLTGGFQYNTIGKIALEARPSYQKAYECVKLSVETLFEYINMSSINNIAAGVGICLDFNCVSAKSGYYYRLYFGEGGKITEPFNIYYEFRAHFLRKVEKWILDLVITNCEIFEIERHYQPSYIAEACYCPIDKLGISFGIGCKPSGAFNLSAGYYQSYLKTGICYRW